MSHIACPACKATLEFVRPKRVNVQVDDVHWKGRVPEAMGFVCPNCDTLLPLTATQSRDDVG
jgi:uncharacterized protein YbaR (Trm112 family)